MAEKSACDRDCIAHKAWNIYYLALYRKDLPIPVSPEYYFLAWLR